MNSDMQISPLLRALVGGACVVVIVAGLKVAAPILNIIFIAWLLAYALTPLPNWLMRKRVPPWLSVLVSLLVVVVGGLSVASLFGTSVAGLARKLPTYQARLTNLQETATTLLASRGLDISQVTSLEILSPNRFVGFAGVVLGSIGNVAGNAVLIIFLVAILLFEFAGRQTRPGIDQADFWGWVLGPAGAILAVPLTLAAKNLVTQHASEPPTRGRTPRGKSGKAAEERMKG